MVRSGTPESTQEESPAEAHDPDNPVWIYDSFNHSEDYNHSTFNDLVLSGLLGIRPQLTDTVQVHPLVPDSWDHFAIENLPYHGRNLTVLWDKDGSNYHQGPVSECISMDN